MQTAIDRNPWPQAIYIAARFSRRHECHALGKLLETAGHRIVSRWTLPNCDHVMPGGISEQAADIERERFATEDLEDVSACDWMIVLTSEPRNNGRGGYHVEFGMAIGMGKRLTVVGPRETVFHHLPEVCHYTDVAAFVRQNGLSRGAA